MDMTECLHCDGTGDLDAARLLEAYRIGRQEVIDALFLRTWGLKERLERPEYGANDLKRMVGS